MSGDKVTAFLASHYNYWVIVVLMMLGLYAVFASGNLVKRLVGLGVFQTSVFLLYITAGKVRGGVPPILPETHHGADHGGDAHGADAHGGGAHGAGAHGGEAPAVGADGSGVSAAHGALDESHWTVHDAAGQALRGAEDHGLADPGPGAAAAPAPEPAPSAGLVVEPVQATYGADALEVAYSNPLPHVLILTAIVVGVATLAVGLALVVRIRDAYGSIEDDELEQRAHEQELADAASAPGGVS